MSQYIIGFLHGMTLVINVFTFVMLYKAWRRMR